MVASLPSSASVVVGVVGVGFAGSMVGLGSG
jgi:hypothetical protein